MNSLQISQKSLQLCNNSPILIGNSSCMTSLISVEEFSTPPWVKVLRPQYFSRQRKEIKCSRISRCFESCINATVHTHCNICSCIYAIVIVSRLDCTFLFRLMFVFIRCFLMRLLIVKYARIHRLLFFPPLYSEALSTERIYYHSNNITFISHEKDHSVYTFPQKHMHNLCLYNKNKKLVKSWSKRRSRKAKVRKVVAEQQLFGLGVQFGLSTFPF